jgi:hypothetical protein
MWRDGPLLVVRKGEPFPDRCVKTNRPAQGRRVQQAVERGHALLIVAHLFNLFNPIVGAIAGATMAKFITSRVTFTVGLSEEWRRKRRRAFCWAGGVMILSIAAMVYGLVLFDRGSDSGLWLLALGLASLLGGLAYGLNASTLVTAKRITRDYFWLKGVHPDFLASLPPWPGEPRADLQGPGATAGLSSSA